MKKHTVCCRFYKRTPGQGSCIQWQRWHCRRGASVSSTPNPCDTRDRKVFNSATERLNSHWASWISRVDKFPRTNARGICLQAFKFLDFFVESETIEGKIRGRVGGHLQSYWRKKKRRAFPYSQSSLHRAQPKPPFRHILVSESTVDNIDSSVLRPI